MQNASQSFELEAEGNAHAIGYTRSQQGQMQI